MRPLPSRFALAAALAATLFCAGAQAGPSVETPTEEEAQKQQDWDVPQAVIDHIAYMEELEARFADADPRTRLAALRADGERAALIYCKAIGFSGPCTIDDPNAGQFRLSSEAELRSGTPWWSWLTARAPDEIGLISAGQCAPFPYAPVDPVVIHMDDEDSANSNGRSGWIGATGSDGNTTWRFCRARGVDYRALQIAHPDYDYAVLKLGAYCPPGAKTIKRWQDNQDGNNQNWSQGNVYPNVNARGRNWITYYCYFEGGARNVYVPGWMSTFPQRGYPHGVFASERLPRIHALDYGWVFQDDENFLNVNRWNPGPRNPDVMRGGGDTWRGIVRVE